MGLQSALSTALTGMTAAETSIDVAGNNVANANTVGFKESTVNFATQFLQTQSIGSAPTDGRGGTNPRQIGLGTKVAEITPDFTQGTVEISSNPLDLAIQGDGFFIVQGPQGEQYYTRNGQFKTNGKNEVVTLTGHRVLGFSVDSNFDIQPTGLTPITIPLGAAAVAQATQTVTMKGALNPDVNELGTIPEIIQSGILSDGMYEVPVGIPDASAMTRPSIIGMTRSTSGGSVNPTPPFTTGTYNYRITYVDTDGNEGPASSLMEFTVGGGQDWLQFDNIPQPSDPTEFNRIRIYRNNPAVDASFKLAGELDISGGPVTTFQDTSADNSLPVDPSVPTLVDQGLDSNSYSYYVTFYHEQSAEESRPTARFGPITADLFNQPRIRLDDIPAPQDPQYNRIRIYRNIAQDPNSFYLVDTILPGRSYVDSKLDGDIKVPENRINLDGPAIKYSTKLVDVVSRNGADYNKLFGVGELSFSGDKGGRQLGDRTLNISATTTVQELIAFMEQSMGIVKNAPESTFPGGEAYEGDLNANLVYGGDVIDSRLQFTSNLGDENELSIDLSAFKFTPTGGVTESVQLPFTTLQEGNGAGATADYVVYDSLGTPLNVRVTTVLEEVSSTGARFRWIATCPQNSPDSGFSTMVGTGVITTDGDGKFVSATEDRIAIDRGESPANSPLEFKMDFGQITGLSQEKNSLAAANQDGFPAGTLTSFIITESGLIQGVFSNGSSRDLGQLRMARFANNGGLQQVGDNMYAAGVNSGLPTHGDPGSNGIGAVTTGAVELSNTDIGQNLIELIMASTQYRGGARVITAVQQLLDELLALRR